MARVSVDRVAVGVRGTQRTIYADGGRVGTLYPVTRVPAHLY